ncbi:cytochrome P450 4c3 [Caerostris extrusa]|uniref:Cytochrome P450 4c3 n=1 Tax=Caerostris extrusa TaxID=172846 RepID=A0AAV4NIU6_CAEEX|nr:cytochrome P450 4c3 [Caerostris extrusa]
MLEKAEDEPKKLDDDDDNDVNTKKRKAFLDLLLDLHIKDNVLSERDIREEVDTFMFAGHDTTAMGISWVLYNIGLRQDIQDTIHDELDRIFGSDQDRPVTMEDVRDMKYLECVIKESQRLYPSLPVIGRELEEDVIIDGHTVPAGTTCMLATFMLHRNRKFSPIQNILIRTDFYQKIVQGDIHLLTYPSLLAQGIV